MQKGNIYSKHTKTRKDDVVTEIIIIAFITRMKWRQKKKEGNNDPEPNTKQDSNLSMRGCI